MSEHREETQHQESERDETMRDLDVSEEESEDITGGRAAKEGTIRPISK